MDIDLDMSETGLNHGSLCVEGIKILCERL
jgi:hypothetical protein